jgi:hypothetical protein
VVLPPFPVDDATLDLLEAAILPREHGDPDAESSVMFAFLEFVSQMGGSDVAAVAEDIDDQTRVLRDPEYSDHDVMLALIAEIRRLRAAGGVAVP